MKNAKDSNDLRKLKLLHFEKLSGDLKGKYSIKEMTDTLKGYDQSKTIVIPMRYEEESVALSKISIDYQH